MIAPFLDPDLPVGLPAPRVVSINTSGHKYGLVYPGVGWVLWRDAEPCRGARLQRQLPRRQHADLRAQLLAPGRPGRRAVLQLLPARVRGIRRVQQASRDVAMRSPAGSPGHGGFELITRGDELPVFAFTTDRRGDRLDRVRVSRRCASAAGRCLRTRSRRTAPTLPHFVWSSDEGSPTTWPTCS